MRLYINGCYAISAQREFSTLLTNAPTQNYAGTMNALPVNYADYLDAGNTRRLSKVVKNAWCCAVEAIKNAQGQTISKIITATAFGCLSDTILFLNKIKDFPEVVSPTPFIQSTHNTVAGFVGMQLKLHGLNKTISQRNFSFEHGLIDGLINTTDNENILLIGFDEITPELSWIAESMGLINHTEDNSMTAMESNTNYTAIGEIYTAFILSNEKNSNTKCRIKDIRTIRIDAAKINEYICQMLLDNGLKPEDIDIFINGSNGIKQYDMPYQILSTELFSKSTLLHYKHLCGESFTASGYAVYLAANILHSQQIPSAMFVNSTNKKSYRNCLIYNYFEDKHSIILLTDE